MTMSIWEYVPGLKFGLLPDEEASLRDNYGNGLDVLRQEQECAFCHATLRRLEAKDPQRGPGDWSDAFLNTCAICGWWVILRTSGYAYGSYEGAFGVRRAAGELRTLSIADIATPVNELQRYLLLRPQERFRLHPRKLENIVGGIFSDFGFEVRITGYSRDRGIDVFVLDGKDNATIGVQVKRSRNKIQVDQVRTFVGALIQNDLTKGIFITTSDYTKGARGAAAEYWERGFAVELWNADDFYDGLALSRRPEYERADDPDAPYYPLWRDAQLVPVVFNASW